MERHPLIGVETIDRHPPVQLARRRRIPGVSMRMMGVSDPRGQIVGRIGDAQARHILKGPMRITSRLHKQALQALLRFRMMDELGLESREDFHRLRYRKLAMRMLRMTWCESGLDLVARKVNQRTACLAWRQDRQFTLISAETATIVATGEIEGNVHCSSKPCKSDSSDD